MADTSDAATETPDAADIDHVCLRPLGGILGLLSRRYAMQLVCLVGAIGPARYGDIEETFDGMSSSTLSARFDELVEAGILFREQYAEIPPRVEYGLRETGEELGGHLKPLLNWVEEIDEEEMSVGQE